MSTLLDNKIVIVDYEVGNLRSVQKAFEKIGHQAIISNDHNIIKNADKIVLPGVGGFKDGITNLKNLGLIDVLTQEVIRHKKPFLGICLGMQLLAKKGYENGETNGLGWIDAEVIKFDFNDNTQSLKIPHVGWNNVTYDDHGLYAGIPNNSDFYFVHSYYFKVNEVIANSSADYGINFTTSIQKENIFAFQFHPEKSQEAGLKIIKNFANVKT